MKTARLWFRWIALLALLIGSAPAALPAAAQDDATPAATDEGVAPYRAQVRLSRSAYGPESGTLVHDAETIATSAAGVDLHNFYARARFTVPYDTADHLWDAGFSFRLGRDVGWRVVVVSDGRWYAGLGGDVITEDGQQDALKLDVGEVNEIEFVADGDIGYLAVNREEVATLDLSRRGVSGDVAVGSTYSDVTTNVGTETEFSRFQIWELDPGSPGALPADALDLMDEGRSVADSGEPLAGPSDGELTESSDSIGVDTLGVETADFYARAEVTNPRDGTRQPFDIGFGFRDVGGDSQFRLVFASDGSWYFKYGTAPVLAAEDFTGFNAKAGETNLFEIAVRGDTAIFAINGDEIDVLDVSSSTDAGDVAIGVGFYSLQDVVEGGTTAYADFTVWSLERAPVRPSPSAEPTEEPTEEPTSEVTAEPTEEPATAEPTEESATAEPTEEPVTPSVTTPVPADGETALADYMDRTRSLPVAFGPTRGDLTLEPDSLAFANADVNLRSFIAQAEFLNPYAAADATWDYGFLFRLGEGDEHLRLIVVSTGDWYLTPGVADPIQSGTIEGLRVGANQRNTLTLVVDGDTGYLAVNDTYVATLDLSQVDQSGDIAIGSSFFQGSFQEGGVTGYEDFIVWSLDERPGPDITPEGSVTPEPDITPEGSATPEPAGTLYTSPTYGYTVRYDDTWEVQDESSDRGEDYVRFGNGTSSVDFYSFPSDFTPDQCLDDEFSYYQTADGFSDAQIARDTNDNDMRGEIDDWVWGVFWFTFTSDGESTDYTAYVECHPLQDGVVLRIVQFVPFDAYNDEIDARVTLLQGFSLTGEGPGPTVTTGPEPTETATETATAAATEEPTTEPGPAESAVVRIEALGGSGIEGLATIDADGDRSRVRLLLLGAEDGAIALIQSGTCSDPSGEPAFLLNDVEGGLSETTIRVALPDLLDGGYVLTVHDSLDSLGDPVACGAIARG